MSQTAPKPDLYPRGRSMVYLCSEQSVSIDFLSFYVVYLLGCRHNCFAICFCEPPCLLTLCISLTCMLRLLLYVYHHRNSKTVCSKASLKSVTPSILLRTQPKISQRASVIGCVLIEYHLEYCEIFATFLSNITKPLSNITMPHYVTVFKHDNPYILCTVK